MAEQQSGSQQNVLPLDWSSWSVGPTQQYPFTTSTPCFPPLDGCDDSQPYPPYYHSSPPDFRSTNQRYSGEPETPRNEESHNPEGSTGVFSSPRYTYLKQDERFILNARLRQEPWKVIEEAYKKHGFESYESPNFLQMKVTRLKEKYPEVKAMLEKSNPITEAGRSVKRKKRQTARTSGADDDTTASNDGEEGVQRLSAEEAIRAAQTVLYFLGQPDCDGLVPPEDCMALIRILSQLSQLNRLNQQ